MVSTRGKKKAASSNKTPDKNEAAEIALAEKLTSDSVTVNVEKPKVNTQLEDKVCKTFDNARNENFGGMFEEEEESENVAKTNNDDQNTAVTEMNVANKVELEENTSVDYEIDDKEGMLWEDDEEYAEHDNEERVDEYEFSEEEATEEGDENNKFSEEEATEEDDDEDEVSEEGAIEEDDDDDDEEDEEEEEEGDGGTPEEKETANAMKTKAKEDGRKAEENNTEKLEVSVRNSKKSSEKSRKKNVHADRLKEMDLTNKAESSRKRREKKRVKSMGMIFMCSSKTKDDCYQYRVLGLPESKKDIVEKIYTGMRLFLYDVDLKLMYGIYKAAGPGGYNIEPKAFKSQFPSQVRFKILNNCLPLAEEKFKKVIKDNYFTKTKFDCQLSSDQVKKLCKLFVTSSKGRPAAEGPSIKLGMSRKAEKHTVRKEKMRRQRAGDELRLPLREEMRRQRAGDVRRLPLRQEIRYDERPHKRPRKVASTTSPLHQRLPALLPSIPSSYVHERTSDVVAYRRDLYLESRSPDKYRHDRVLNLHDPYGKRLEPPIERDDRYVDVQDTPIERNDRYRYGRDPYLEHHYTYKDGQDPYIERRNPYRDAQDPYPRHRDPYGDERDPYLERPVLYRDRQDPSIERYDSHRDGRDLYLKRRVPYRDATHSELYSTYKRGQLSDRRDVYREDRGVGYHDSYRRHDIASHDSYVSNREPPSFPEPIYLDEYSSQAGVYRL